MRELTKIEIKKISGGKGSCRYDDKTEYSIKYLEGLSSHGGTADARTKKYVLEILTAAGSISYTCN